MEILELLADRIGNLAEKSADILADTLNDNSAFIEDAVAGQMEAGKRADGSDILPSYDPDYARAKAALGLQASHVDLKVTGEFHAGIRAQADRLKRQLNIIGTDEKTPSLVSKYDVKGQLINLSEENLSELEQSYVLEDQIRELTNYLLNG